MTPLFETEELHITEVRFRVTKKYDLPGIFYDATMGPFADYSLSALTLVDADGTVGEAPLMVRNAKELFNDVLSPILLTGGPVLYKDLYQKLYWRIRNFGFRSMTATAVGAIDLALHDLFANRRGIPLISASEYLCGLSEWCLTKYVSCFPITRNLYLRVPFLFKKQLSMI